MIQLIPAIDIINGQLVRLHQGDYSQKTVYATTPLDMAMHYQSLGLHDIHVVDLNGAKSGVLENESVINAIVSNKGLSVQVGGGIRCVSHAQALFNLGVSSIIIGSLLVHDFNGFCKIVEAYPNRVTVGLDIRNGMIATDGWTETSDQSIESVLHALNQLPLKAIISTDIEKDGTFSGLNIDLYRLLSTKSVHPVIASGGVSSIDDVIALSNENLSQVVGCIVGKAIIENRITDLDVNRYLTR